MKSSATLEMVQAVEWNGNGRTYEVQRGRDENDLMDSTRPYATEQSRWEALVERAADADGQFFYGVSTTGIYCRPVCASRLPNRENVRFFDDAPAAEAAGYRPCKRCNPGSPGEVDAPVQAIIDACRIIEEAETPPSLEELACAVGLSKYHFHRLFKKITGITPKQYASEIRANRARNELQKEPTVTDAIYNAGFESSSRFYETAGASLGMTPREYSRGGAGQSIRYAIVESYLGWVLIAATAQGICRIDFDDSAEPLRERLQSSFAQADLLSGDAEFEEIVNQVLHFLERPQTGLDLPLDIQGTAFQQRVWAALREIPAGLTASYGEVAAQIGRPSASRAVAGACAANHIAVAVPCHRVIRSDGGLGGYRWGTARKRQILQREAE
jgi:AraC family transcriptional regulator, regulatory protein of adaptative response / methylated-DNA-[protein]-cysteine methyltransferase